ncbi:MAG TPA: zf-HC2 domain-containing protein, partial [Caulobacteraceae bacterium]
MGSIIRLNAGPHEDIRALLPWYVTGRLDAHEQARIAAHLKTCRTCQEDVEFERRLEVEVAAAPIDVEHGWTAMRRRMAEAPVPARHSELPGALGRRLGGLWRGRSWVGWA